MVHELGYRDKVIIPDKYNTGCFGTLTPVAQKFNNWSGYITSAIVSENGSSTFKDIHFNTSVAVKCGTAAAYIDEPLTFVNCKFDAGDDYAVKVSGTWTENCAWTFINCDFSTYTSAITGPVSNCVVKNCKIHDMKRDGGKGYLHGGYENCYFYNIGTGIDIPNNHADAIQTTVELDGFYVKNCRFDVPQTSENVINAGIFFCQAGDATDCQFEDILINGGNYCFWIDTEQGYTPTFTDVTGRNISLGAAHNFAYPFMTTVSQFSNWTSNGTVVDQDKLFVSSVFLGANGKIKVHASNYTLSSRTLVVVTDEETKSFTVPAHFTYAEGVNHTFSEFPYDLEYEVSGSYAICYDTSVSDANEIRFQYCTADALFGDIADAIRTKQGSSDDIYRGNIPKEIIDIPEPTGTISITANGTGIDVSAYAEADVAVPQGITPTGTINISTNGDTDVTNYATAHVAVPQPSGKITITSNGTDVDVSSYATADIAVPQGVFPTGSQTYTQNGTYDVTNLAEAVVNVSSLPSYMSITDETIPTDGVTYDTLVSNYDTTRTIDAVYFYGTDLVVGTAYNVVFGFFERNRDNGNYTGLTGYNSGNGTESITAQYGSLVIDSVNGTITMASRTGGNYSFPNGKTYRVIIIYTT